MLCTSKYRRQRRKQRLIYWKRGEYPWQKRRRSETGKEQREIERGEQRGE
jgi:hypothetical protein